MYPWNQSRSPEFGETEAVSEHEVSWVRASTGAQVTLISKFPNTPEYYDVFRTACHYAIEYLPDEGLSELYVTLGEMIEFYNDRLEPWSKDLALPKITTKSAIHGTKYERKPFYVTTD